MNKKIISFCHIIKCSGTTLSSLLRRSYGMNQLSVMPKPGETIYGREQLKRDIRIFPNMRSITGHGLRPYIDYGDMEERLEWFSWLREPTARLISGYQHSIEKGGRNISFEDWLREPLHRNIQVYFLTGSEDDLDGAKEVILNKMRFVGLVERFDESLVLFKHIMGLEDLNIDYPKPANAAIKGRHAADIYEDLEKYRDLIECNTSVDQALYRWFVDEIYPTYVSAFGGERLAPSVEEVFKRAEVPSAERRRELLNNAFRKTIYEPLLRRI